jgi:SAM-dependent methyltransferase
MVQEYNTGASNQGIAESEMHAVVGNLIDPSKSLSPDPSLAEKHLFDFDIAAVGMGWHHFSDPGFAAKKLAERLKTGGVLLIIDFLPHEGFENAHDHARGGGKGHDHGEQVHDRGEGHVKESAAGELGSEAAHTVTHFGFNEEHIKKMFEEAGVGVGFDFVVLGKGVVFQREGKSLRRTVFMARGRKG